MYILSSSLTTFLILTALPYLVETPTLLTLLELSLSILDDLLPVDFLCSVIDEAFSSKIFFCWFMADDVFSSIFFGSCLMCGGGTCN